MIDLKKPVVLVGGAILGFGLMWLVLSQKAGGGGTRRTGTLTIFAHPTTDSTPISGVTVRIRMTDGYASIDQTKTTDALGLAVFPNIPEGYYQHTLTKTDYVPWDVNRQVLFDSDGTTQHSFGLSRLV